MLENDHTNSFNIGRFTNHPPPQALWEAVKLTLGSFHSIKLMSCAFCAVKICLDVLSFVFLATERPPLETRNLWDFYFWCNRLKSPARLSSGRDPLHKADHTNWEEAGALKSVSTLTKGQRSGDDRLQEPRSSESVCVRPDGSVCVFCDLITAP